MTEGISERTERLSAGRTIWERFLLEIVEITWVNLLLDRTAFESLYVQVERSTYVFMEVRKKTYRGDESRQKA